MKPSGEIETLIELMSKLPGLGPRSARRAVLHLIKKRSALLITMTGAMRDVAQTARECLFTGRYHVLGGTLSALDAIGPDELRIPKLIDRIATESVSEVILALNATVEGQTTAHYIADQLPQGVTVTSLAQGVPIGGELDYLDDGTIGAAMKARRQE